MDTVEYDVIRGSAKRLLTSVHTAAISDEVMQKIDQICSEARSTASMGDYEEAHRLIHFARNLLIEQSRNLGRGGLQE